MSTNSWSNRLSFIITTSAFSVGLGNIWRFPYITGEGGGGAFLITYLILIFLIGIPIMTMEIGLGRMSGTTPLLGYAKLANRKSWAVVGWIEVITVLFIMMFYVMILAWVLIYFFECISGNISAVSPEQLPSHFDSISTDIFKIFLFIVGIMLTAIFIVSRGLQNGLEKYSKWMMIALIIMMIALAIWAATLSGASEGYSYFLSPDFSKINLNVILSAMGQLFFSLGVGMAAAFAFGSYTSKNDNLISSTSWIVFMDSIIAVLAGLLIFPVIFSFNLQPDSGPNLIFITMASVFGKLAFGSWLGAIFFLLLFLAGYTSLLSCMQGLKDSFRDKYRLPEFKALLLVAGMIALGSIPVVLSYLPEPIRFGEMTVYNLLDYLTGNVLLPLGGLMIVIFGAHIVGYDKLVEHLKEGATSFNPGSYWRPIIKWVIPVAVLIILVNGLL